MVSIARWDSEYPEFDVWNLSTQTLLYTKEGLSPCFSADGQIIATHLRRKSPHGTYPIHLVDANTGQVIQEFEGHPGYIHRFRMSLQGMIASAAEDGRVYIWTNQLLKTVRTNGDVMDIQFSPDGRILAILDESGTVQLRHLSSHPRGSNFILVVLSRRSLGGIN